jgi:RNA polymerase sigma-70 factor (ECF subfamily)
VTLADQDRSRWHADEICAGLELVAGLRPGTGYAEELRLQTLIAAEHGRARTATETDWEVIAHLYADLEALTGSAVVRLNRAVAIAQSESPQAGLALLRGLDVLLPRNHRVASVRGELARRTGNTELARTSYLAALDLCSNEVERAHLRDRLDSLSGDGG